MSMISIEDRLQTHLNPDWSTKHVTFKFRLKDSVVIIDEAHNLIETINDIHSVTIHQKDCSTTHRKLNIYLRKVTLAPFG